MVFFGRMSLPRKFPGEDERDTARHSAGSRCALLLRSLSEFFSRLGETASFWEEASYKSLRILRAEGCSSLVQSQKNLFHRTVS
jgi:hypothetical protein